MGIPKHFYLMVDTETCGDLENPYVYDLGMAIIDRKGKSRKVIEKGRKIFAPIQKKFSEST